VRLDIPSRHPWYPVAPAESLYLSQICALDANNESAPMRYFLILVLLLFAATLPSTAAQSQSTPDKEPSASALLSATSVFWPGGYFSQNSFLPYDSAGPYPFWSTTWTQLDRRFRRDAEGVPYIVYANGPAYNPTTVAQMGLLAYNPLEIKP